MSQLKYVKLTDTAPVARLTLARPPLNVLNIAMINEMNSCLEALIQKSDLCALLIDAEGAHFCAGVDVGEHKVDTVPFMLGSFHKLIRLLHGFPSPVVCAVQGNALGGGLELATICDITVTASNARLGVPEITLGVFPPVAIAYLHRLVGVAKSAELILTGATVDAAEALRIGLVSRVCEEAELARVAEELTGRLARHSAFALKETKRALRQASLADFGGALAKAESIYLEDLMKGHDPTEGLVAFLEKRKPQWTHR